jgi:hypothetical protein
MSKPKVRAKTLAANPAKIHDEKPQRQNNIVRYLMNNYSDHPALVFASMQIREMFDRGIHVDYAMVDYLMDHHNDQGIQMLQARLRSQQQAERRKARTGYVYFVQNGDRIKIGHSVDPGQRVLSLSLRLSDILGVIEGNQRFERHLHQMFADYRIGDTEWFHDCQALREYIDQYAEVFHYRHPSRQGGARIVTEEDGYRNLLRAIRGDAI